MGASPAPARTVAKRPPQGAPLRRGAGILRWKLCIERRLSTGAMRRRPARKAQRGKQRRLACLACLSTYPREEAPAAAVRQAAAEPARASIAPQRAGGSTIVAGDARRPPGAVRVRNDRYIPRTIVKRRFPERFGLHARSCAGGGRRRR
ncbi:hypothetical protein predicted by Glimmer/Critica [Sorangium cellulosum So ce56]|uniref:Uncharacterized protein n=1 Tax=Sorangium cellulosum (strain So ce56) TaxID=448385 RepID=A9GYB3_SORC5|nr:hypothetical protein predicted by Glimmer/Critica [Sorangium cellulosum So ce56]